MERIVYLYTNMKHSSIKLSEPIFHFMQYGRSKAH